MKSQCLRDKSSEMDQKRKICFGGFPRKPTELTVINAEHEGILSWGPPKGMEDTNLTYSVWLPEYKGCEETGEEGKPRFLMVYQGSERTFPVTKEQLAPMFARVRRGKSAYVFRVAARNERGHGPSTQLIWEPDQGAQFPTDLSVRDGGASTAATSQHPLKSRAIVTSKDINQPAEKFSNSLVFSQDVPSGFSVNLTLGRVHFSWSPPTSRTLDVYGYFLSMAVDDPQESDSSHSGDTSDQLRFKLIYHGRDTCVSFPDGILFSAHVDSRVWPTLTFKLGTYDSSGFPGPLTTCQWRKPLKSLKGHARSLTKWVLVRETLKKHKVRSTFPFPRDLEYF